MGTASILLLGLAHARGMLLSRRAHDARASQEHVLAALLRRAAGTAFGRAHRFDRISDYRAFAERVPIHRYPDIQPWLKRALDGEHDVTWPGRMPYFAWSSGTTAGVKYLPISMDAVRQQQRGGIEPMMAYLRWTADRGLLDGPSILLGGSSDLERHPKGALIGQNTGIMANHIPRVARHKQRPSPRVRSVADWDRKMDLIARESVHEDVRMVAGCAAWFPGFFDRVLVEARRQGMAADTVLDVWPNLRLITGGGVSYEPYRPLMESRLGRRVAYVDVYNATEGGIMGVQDRADDAGMLLLPDAGNFYELVPADELDSPQPTRLPLWEAEVGVRYALLVSTRAGLWAYAIGDCIRFVETFPHRFVFEGRVGGQLNVAGELVSQGELERAVRRACAETGAEIADFTVCADVGVEGSGAARHVFVVEFSPRSVPPVRFAGVLDDDLKAQNGDYSAHRSCADSLRAPIVRPVPPGTFHDWMKERGKLGGQNKVPRIVLDRAARESLERVSATLLRGEA